MRISAALWVLFLDCSLKSFLNQYPIYIIIEFAVSALKINRSSSWIMLDDFFNHNDLFCSDVLRIMIGHILFSFVCLNWHYIRLLINAISNILVFMMSFDLICYIYRYLLALNQILSDTEEKKKKI